MTQFKMMTTLNKTFSLDGGSALIGCVQCAVCSQDIDVFYTFIDNQLTKVKKKRRMHYNVLCLLIPFSVFSLRQATA